METIKKLTNKDWNKFYFSEVYKDQVETKNYNQLFDSEINGFDKKLRYFSEPLGYGEENKVYFLYYHNDLIVGHLTFQYPPKDQNTPLLIWMNAVSVDPAYKNKGIATKLVETAFKWAKDNGYEVLSSYYEKEGLLYLKNLQRRTAKKFKLKFIDKECIDFEEMYFEWGTENHGKNITKKMYY